MGMMGSMFSGAGSFMGGMPRPTCFLTSVWSTH